MTFPNFKDKYKRKALVTGAQYLKYAQNQGIIDYEAPQSVIFTYSSKLFNYVGNEYFHQEVAGGKLLLLAEYDVGVVGNIGIGAPITSNYVEILQAMGTERFYIVGTAGAISKDLDIGDISVVTKAIRDDGVSHHYLSPKKYVDAFPALTKKITEKLKDTGIEFSTGPSWTIDAPYRETIDEVKEYQEEGVLTVEMEAATLFSMAQYFQKEAGVVLGISDSLSDLTWDPQFHSNYLQKRLRNVIDVIISL